MSTIRIKEAAQYLGLSEYLVRKMCKAKQLPHIKAGGIYLFRESSLDEWMNQQESKNANTKPSNQIYGIHSITE